MDSSDLTEEEQAILRWSRALTKGQLDHKHGPVPDQAFHRAVLDDLARIETRWAEERNRTVSEMIEGIANLTSYYKRETQILSVLGDGLIVTDREGQVQRVNAAFERMSGRDAKALRQSDFGALFTDAAGADALLHNMLQGAEAPSSAQYLRSFGAPSIPVLVTCSTVGGSGVDSVEQLVFLVKDMRAQRQSQADLKEMEAQFTHASKLAEVGTLAAGLAHEINNPLTYVSQNLRTLSDGQFKLPTDARVLLSEALDGIERITQIVQDLKVFSRARTDAQISATDTHLTLDTALRLTENHIQHKAQLIRKFGEIPPVAAIESKLTQVFLNLLINAAQSIEAGAFSQNRITVSTELVDHRVLIEIEDTGCGIPSEHQDQIFEPYFTTKPEGEGTGLGLSLCHRMVEAMGGEVRVHSELGAGTKVSVYLPKAASTKNAPARALTPAPKRHAEGLRVLVVDDQELVLRAIGRMLPMHRLTLSSSAREALAHLESDDAYDAILCDLMMPDVDGAQFFEKLGLLSPPLRRKTVFMTGGLFERKLVDFVEEIDNPCVDKPLREKQLQAALSQVFKKPSG